MIEFKDSNRVILFLLIIVFAGCGKKSEKNDTQTINKTKNIAEKKILKQKSPGPEKTEKDDPRINALNKEYAGYGEKEVIHSAETLSDDEKKMFAHLLKASSCIEKLYMLQRHPKNLQWEKKIMSDGLEIEKKIFRRYRSPWCSDNQKNICSALPSLPVRKIGKYHWPDDFEDKEIDVLKRQINKRELLSPYTLVRRKNKSSYNAIPYARDELFGPWMIKTADELTKAAGYAPSEKLKKFLNSRALAFKMDVAYPYDDSDYDWIALDGDWEVTVGPYETYTNPYQIKALFQMYIGKRVASYTSRMNRLKDNLQEMENSLGELVGLEIYKSRKLDHRIAISVVDIWMASGNGRRDRGAVAAYHLPNRGKSIDEGLYKKVIMINHMKTFIPVTKKRAEIILAERQRKYVDFDSDVINVTCHEMAHGFGSYGDMSVKTPSGKLTTVKNALGKYESLMEELKADITGLWLVMFEKNRGFIDETEVAKRYVSAFMHIFGLFQYPLLGIYPRMASVELGWLLDKGALTWDEKDELFKVNVELMPEAVESLTREVSVIMLTGDLKRAKALIGRYVEVKSDRDVSVKGILKNIRKILMDKLAKAKIKSPSLTYRIDNIFNE